MLYQRHQHQPAPEKIVKVVEHSAPQPQLVKIYWQKRQAPQSKIIKVINEQPSGWASPSSGGWTSSSSAGWASSPAGWE